MIPYILNIPQINFLSNTTTTELENDFKHKLKFEQLKQLKQWLYEQNENLYKKHI